jgi:hypothetical protein
MNLALNTRIFPTAFSGYPNSGKQGSDPGINATPSTVNGSSP